MWCICGARLSTKTTSTRGVPYPANVALVHRTAKSSRSRGVAKPTCWLTQQRATRLPSRPTLAMQIWLMMPACQASSSPNASLVWSKMPLTTPAASTVMFQKMATEAADCERGGGSPNGEREHQLVCAAIYALRHREIRPAAEYSLARARQTAEYFLAAAHEMCGWSASVQRVLVVGFCAAVNGD